VLGCGATATKVEGALFALAGFAAALICARGHRRAVLLAFGAVVVSALPWLAWTKMHHIGSDLINSTTLSPHHLRVVAPFAWLSVKQIVHYWPGLGWPLLFASIVACALAAWTAQRRNLVAFLGLVWTLSTIGMWAQYVIATGHARTDKPTVSDVKAHFASSAPRVLLVPAIVISLAIPLFAGSALRSDPEPAASPALPETAPAPAEEAPAPT
jgi:hypothetical protein